MGALILFVLHFFLKVNARRSREDLLPTPPYTKYKLILRKIIIQKTQCQRSLPPWVMWNPAYHGWDVHWGRVISTGQRVFKWTKCDRRCKPYCQSENRYKWDTCKIMSSNSINIIVLFKMTCLMLQTSTWWTWIMGDINWFMMVLLLYWSKLLLRYYKQMMMLNICSDSRFKIKETFIDRNDENRNKTFYSGDLMAWTFGFQVLNLDSNICFILTIVIIIGSCWWTSGSQQHSNCSPHKNTNEVMMDIFATANVLSSLQIHSLDPEVSNRGELHL